MVLMIVRTANASVVPCQSRTLSTISFAEFRSSCVSSEILASVDAIENKQSSMVTSLFLGFVALVDLGLVFFITELVLLCG